MLATYYPGGEGAKRTIEREWQAQVGEIYSYRSALHENGGRQDPPLARLTGSMQGSDGCELAALFILCEKIYVTSSPGRKLREQPDEESPKKGITCLRPVPKRCIPKAVSSPKIVTLRQQKLKCTPAVDDVAFK